MVLMRFAKWMVPFRASEYPQIREKPLRSKSAASDGVPVRVRSPAPRRSKLCIACSDFFQKSERTYAAAPPFQPRPACAGLASDDENGSDIDCSTAPKKTPLGVFFLCYKSKIRTDLNAGVRLSVSEILHRIAAILSELCWRKRKYLQLAIWLQIGYNALCLRETNSDKEVSKMFFFSCNTNSNNGCGSIWQILSQICGFCC